MQKGEEAVHPRTPRLPFGNTDHRPVMVNGTLTLCDEKEGSVLYNVLWNRAAGDGARASGCMAMKDTLHQPFAVSVETGAQRYCGEDGPLGTDDVQLPAGPILERVFGFPAQFADGPQSRGFGTIEIWNVDTRVIQYRFSIIDEMKEAAHRPVREFYECSAACNSGHREEKRTTRPPFRAHRKRPVRREAGGSPGIPIRS